MTFMGVKTVPIGFDSFALMPSPHADDNAAAHQSVRQPAETGQSDGAKSFCILWLDCPASDDAPPDLSATAVASI
jgi:hypothetical protein